MDNSRNTNEIGLLGIICLKLALKTIKNYILFPNFDQMKIPSRLSYFRDKLQVFFLGLLFGLVIGGGFFLLKMDQYVKELSFYRSITAKQDKNDLVKVENNTETEKKPSKKYKNESSSMQIVDTAITVEVASKDSASAIVAAEPTDIEEIVIRKEEQVAAKNYLVINLNKEKKDSLAKETSNANLAVEFWKSPLNSYGYKFSRSKLVLYGYGDQDLVSVIKIDNLTILKCITGFFKIEPTADFQQLERVTDATMLSKIQ